MIKPFPQEAGHPANHGYARCVLCGAWRPSSRLNNHGGEQTARLACDESCQPSTKPSHFDPPTPTTKVPSSP